MNTTLQNRSPNTTSLKHVIIGTAGHIDHGKTRLVSRLTGAMTDRLPEEKTRGISIDLGFAHWEDDGFQFGVVDVPGHERFVKNMVAGATGVNLALLVIAADDSVMPQTREHLEIMDLLGVTTGVVAITKIDLIEPEMVELVREEVEELTAGTFLEGCPIIAVSSETAEGIDELRQTITATARDIDWPESRDVFRLPIDRVFTLTGHGTIVTGSVVSGEVHTGEILELLPEQREVRVRSVQSHGAGVEEGTARRRTAVNLAGMKTNEVRRGMELATPGYLRPTTRLVVRLRNLASSPVTLKDRFEAGLHLGTAELPVRIILKGRKLKPGESGFAELRSREPCVAAFGQRFILRRMSPAVTIGGGTVLAPGIPTLKRIKDLNGFAAAAGADDPADRLSFLLSQKDDADISPLEAAWQTGIRRNDVDAFLDDFKRREMLMPLGDRDRTRWIHRDRLSALCDSVMRTVHKELKKHQPRRSLPRNTLMTACRRIAPPDVLDAVFDHLLQTKRLVKVGKNIGPADAQVQLTKKQRQTQEAILAAISEGGLMPPTVKQLAASTEQDIPEIEQLLNVCVEDGVLVRVDEQLHFTPEALEEARRICAEYLREHTEASMSQLREAWGVSRKFSVPLCEYFDSLGLTVRKGDVRIAGAQLLESLNGDATEE